MSQGTVSKMNEVPVNGTEFKWCEGQNVYIFVDGAEELSEGVIVARGSYPSSSENVYRVELNKKGKKIRSLYNESNLIGRHFAIFNKGDNKPATEEIYNSLQQAIDAEEDLGYDILTAQYNDADGKPDALVSIHFEVYEINPAGDRIGEPIPLD